MTIEVLHVPDCPLVDALLARLREVTHEPVTLRVVATEAEAVAYGMAGSPTLVVDGVDPFGPAEPSLACRLGPPPTVADLREALGRLSLRLDKAAGAAALGAAARGTHVAILGWFVSHGRAPTRFEITLLGGEPATLAELADRDLVAFDAQGELRAAYPFSPTPTRHRLLLGNGAALYAMCAIDALGTSAMLGVPVTIRTTEPDAETPIEIHVDGDQAEWSPDTAVVLAGATSDTCCQASIDRTCGTINFFGSRGSAQTWAARHPTITGQVLDQDESLRCAIAEFGPLLDNRWTRPPPTVADLR